MASSSAERWYDGPKYQKVPARALGQSARRVLAKFLNPRGMMTNDTLYSPDWMGLAEFYGYEMLEITNLNLKESPTEALLADWTLKPSSTIGGLFEVLENELQKLDVVYDQQLRKIVEKDAEKYHDKMQPIQDPEVTPSFTIEHPERYLVNEMEVDEDRYITTGEVITNKAEFFDAYVSYDDTNPADTEFVKQMIVKLEQGNNSNQPPIKLCIDARDLIPGTSYHTVTAKLIEQRCKRTILVMSPAYLKSAQCEFQRKFAHSLSPGSRSKRLIPVITDHCPIPPILRHITVCDYTKTDLQEWFWNRLKYSLQAPLKLTELEKAGNDSDKMGSISLPSLPHSPAPFVPLPSTPSYSKPISEPSPTAGRSNPKREKKKKKMFGKKAAVELQPMYTTDTASEDEFVIVDKANSSGSQV